LFLSYFRILISALVFFGVPSSSIAREDAKKTGDMIFTIIETGVCDHCVTVYAAGKIVPDSTRLFQAVLDELEAKKMWAREAARKGQGKTLTLMLNSHGGNVDSAYSIGRQLRLHRANTIVAMPSSSPDPSKKISWSSCLSACGIILLGGIERTAIFASPLGLHQIYLIINRERSYSGAEVQLLLDRHGETSAQLARYFEEMAVSPKLLLQVYKTPREGMHRLSHKLALELGMLTK
jgi:hypothetical protein